MTTKRIEARLGYRAHDQRWSLLTHDKNSNGEGVTVELVARYNGDPEYTDIKFYLACNEGDIYEIMDEQKFKEELELHDQHACDHLNDESEEEAQEARDAAYNRYWEHHKPFSWTDTMGYPGRRLCAALLKRWEAITEIVNLAATPI